MSPLRSSTSGAKVGRRWSPPSSSCSSKTLSRKLRFTPPLSDTVRAELILADSLGKVALGSTGSVDGELVDRLRERESLHNELRNLGPSDVRRCLNRLAEGGFPLQRILDEEEIFDGTLEQFPHLLAERNVSAGALGCMVLLMWIVAIPVAYYLLRTVGSFLGQEVPTIVSAEQGALFWNIVFWTSTALSLLLFAASVFLARVGRSIRRAARERLEDLSQVTGEAFNTGLVLAVSFGVFALFSYLWPRL